MKGTFPLFVASLIALGSSQLAESTPVVHVIAHSHCDAGYRESFDEYWSSSVSFIINSVLDALDKDPDKRFVWEEVSFLSKWWKQASNESQELMKKLHSNGQLEFIGGGWVMHDEADPSLFGILNQMYQGLSFLRETFETRPRVEWHIDPFGHSLFTPELYSLLGYEAVVLSRIPNAVKQAMRLDKGLEFFWHYPSAKSSTPIFAHVLDTHYGTPKLLGLNTQSLVYELVPILKKRLQWFKTDQLLLPFGGDFNFKVAETQFSKMDAIIKYVNANSSSYNLTMRYSTLSEYFSAVKSTSTTFDTRMNDFFPYVPCYPCGAPECENLPCGPANQSNAYWSGFYTSKPAQKLLVQEHEATLKSLEVLNALHPVVSEELRQSVELGRNTSGLLQHHDAITGTSFPPAFDDYNIRLNNAMKTNDGSIASLKSSILCEKPGLGLSSDSVAMLSYLKETNMAAAFVHNPLPVQRSSYISVQLPNGLCTQVYSSNQTLLPSQQISTMLYFPLTLSAWGMEVAFLVKKECEKLDDELKNVLPTAGFSLSNGILTLDFDSNNHLTSWRTVNSKADKSSVDTHSLFQTYQRYDESVSKTTSVTDGANVYTFDPLPTSQTPTTLTPMLISTTVTANGPLVWEAKQMINDFINTTVRLYSPIKSSSDASTTDDMQYTNFAQWQTIVGPLPPSPGMSVTSQFSSSDFNTADYQFITYTNGFYPVTRQYNTSATVQANTYPMVGRALGISASNDHTPSPSSIIGGDALAVIVQRPMALTGRNGSLEMMLHRRLAKKLDPRGDDSTVVNDSVLVGFVGKDAAPAVSARMMSLFQTPPTVHFALLDGTPNDIKGVWSKVCGTKLQWDPSENGIGEGIEIIDAKLLNYTSDGSYQIGLHIIYTDEHASGPSTVDVTALFKEFTTTSVVEATPDFLETPHAAGPILNCKKGGGKECEKGKINKFLIELYPLQLKTLILTLS